MVGKIRKYHNDSFKFKVAITAIKGSKSAGEMIQEFGVAASQIYAWKKQLEENGFKVFADKRSAQSKTSDLEKLYATIGRLTIERDLFVNKLES